MKSKNDGRKKTDAELLAELERLAGVVGRKEGVRRRHIRELLKVRRRRALLIERLGGRCAVCLATNDLEFDHYPRLATYDHNKRSQAQRMTDYERQADAGNLRLLCASCNGAAGGVLPRLAELAAIDAQVDEVFDSVLDAEISF